MRRATGFAVHRRFAHAPVRHALLHDPCALVGGANHLFAQSIDDYEWRFTFPYIHYRNYGPRRKLGILGCGRIGSRVGRAAAGLGMKVLYNDIKKIDLDYPAASVDKDTLFASSDIVTIHVPMTDLTRGFINAQSLAKFKPGAQFINAARGQCVDYHALAAAIRSRAPAGRAKAYRLSSLDPT